MYVQVSSKCNMKCLHCMFSCRPKKGQHMPLDIFRKAIAIAADYDSSIAIGGGEPTLHPDLLAMLGIASFMSSEPIFMVTNGTCDKKLWKILMNARDSEKLSLYVSKDPWHDMDKIKPWVEEDADRHKLWWGNSRIITIVKQGRAKRNIDRLVNDCYNWGIVPRVEENDCDDITVSPDGRVWAHFISTGTIDDQESIDKAFQIFSNMET